MSKNNPFSPFSLSTAVHHIPFAVYHLHSTTRAVLPHEQLTVYPLNRDYPISKMIASAMSPPLLMSASLASASETPALSATSLISPCGITGP